MKALPDDARAQSRQWCSVMAKGRPAAKNGYGKRAREVKLIPVLNRPFLQLRYLVEQGPLCMYSVHTKVLP